MILKDVLSFYESDPLTDDFLSDLELLDRDKNNRNMKCFIWFAALLSLDKEETLKVIEQVRFNRGLTYITRNGSSFMATQSHLGNPATSASLVLPPMCLQPLRKPRLLLLPLSLELPLFKLIRCPRYWFHLISVPRSCLW